MLLYSKVSSLTSYIIKSSQIGKIINLIAGDLGIFKLDWGNFLVHSFFLYMLLELLSSSSFGLAGQVS